MKNKLSFQEFCVFLIALVCSFCLGILIYFLFKSFDYDVLSKQVLDCSNYYNTTSVDDEENDPDVVKLD